MAEINLQGNPGNDDNNPFGSKEGRSTRNTSDTDSLLGRDATREVKATVKELAGVLKELAKVQRQELLNEQRRLTAEKRQQATLAERQQRQDQRKLEREQRRFDRDYERAYQEEDRRSYTSLRYNAGQDNRRIDKERADAEAAAAKLDERPDFGKGHRQWYGMAGYNTAQRFGLSEGSSRAVGSGAARMGGYVADTFGVGGLLEAGLGAGAFDALASAGGPAVEIPALVGTGALATAIAGFQAQGAVTNLAGRFVGSAQPFTDLIKFAANRGRAGNYNGDSLISALFGDTAQRDRDLNQYGIGPNEVGQIMHAYGDRGTSSADILQIAQQVGQANQSNYLGGLGLSQTASLLGFGKTMFGTSSSQSADYFSKWQSVFEQAVALGLDRSQVASTLENMVTQRADSGSANVSLPDASNLFGKFAQSGLAGGRDGSLAQSYSASLNQSWQNAGFGGDLFKTEAAEMLFKRGGSHQTMAQFGKLFGFDPNRLVGSAYTIAQQALAAGNRGDWASFGSAAPPLMSQSAQQQADQLLAGSWFQPGTVAYTAALAALEGTNYSTETGALGSSNLPNPVGLVPGRKVPDDVLAAIQKAAKDKGVDPDQLLALLGNETTWGTKVHDSTKGAVGILQILPKTFEALQKQHLVDQRWTLDQIRKDPVKNAEVAAAAWKQDLQLAGGDPQLAAAYYNGGMTLNDASRGYAAQWQSNYNMLTGANSLSQYNEMFSRDQQLNIASGFTAYKAAEALLTGKPGQSIESGSDVIASIAGSASDFVTGAHDFTGGVSDFKAAVAAFVKGVLAANKNYGRGLTRPSYPNGSPQPLAPAPQTPYTGHRVGGR